MRRRNLTSPAKQRLQIRLAGSGGQGLILAGLLLAEAAGVFDGRSVAMAQSYGPEARGGASKAEVIISDSPIDYPLCTEVDVLLALTQEAADAYSWDLAPGACILVDAVLVAHPPSSRAIALPFTAVARDKVKNPMTANVVALGAISELTAAVSRRALYRALAERLPHGPDKVNKKALSLGVRMAREYERLAQGGSILELGQEDV
jgi:2-oxoglutarate ferredoxin oxidoreductase subunit gamma